MQTFEFSHGQLADLRDDSFATSLSAWSGDSLNLQTGATHFGFVYEGEAELACDSGRFTLSPGMFFCVCGDATIGGTGRGISIARWGYEGLFQIGGPVERTGRMRYIDGCTDTLLVSPALKGDACLNLLHIPADTHQTLHTHPSVRVGIIVEGRGYCETPGGRTDLMPGLIFMIPTNGQHSFHTEDDSLLVIAYHPDSDFGPTHENHPMVNRTIVDGVPASQIPEIATREENR